MRELRPQSAQAWTGSPERTGGVFPLLVCCAQHPGFQLIMYEAGWSGSRL